ncbi:hypothetical protein NDU88_001788 [Pleurodeles waltl]|uniref:Uncharacterized protein n=1 Tax=Pleurodeles waltl TaxID=8319 RepID=A0AAV7S8M1_PLEWA|nr:hypothetical protein NDU88_001788 [Pleurodeles waltl]
MEQDSAAEAEEGPGARTAAASRITGCRVNTPDGATQVQSNGLGAQSEWARDGSITNFGTQLAQQYPGGTIASQVDDPDVHHPRTNPGPAALPGGVFKTQLVIQEGRASAATAPTERRRRAEDCGDGTIGWRNPVEGVDGEKMPRRGEDAKTRRTRGTIRPLYWRPGERPGGGTACRPATLWGERGLTRPIFTKPVQQYPGGTIASRVDDPDVPQPRTNPEPAALPGGVFKPSSSYRRGERRQRQDRQRDDRAKEMSGRLRRQDHQLSDSSKWWRQGEDTKTRRMKGMTRPLYRRPGERPGGGKACRPATPWEERGLTRYGPITGQGKTRRKRERREAGQLSTGKC